MAVVRKRFWITANKIVLEISIVIVIHAYVSQIGYLEIDKNTFRQGISKVMQELPEYGIIIIKKDLSEHV